MGTKGVPPHCGLHFSKVYVKGCPEEIIENGGLSCKSETKWEFKERLGLRFAFAGRAPGAIPCERET
jgi:hypothetical protein